MKTDPKIADIRRARLKDLTREFSQVDIAKAAGISLAQLGQWVSGIRNLSENSARRIEQAVNKPNGWLDIPAGTPLPRGNLVPVVAHCALGDKGYFVELQYPVGHGDGYVDLPSRDPNAYAVRCVGESMAPRIRNGEFVVIEPGHQIAPGDEVLVRAEDGRVMVKTFLYRRDGLVYLQSVNEAHPTIHLRDEEISAMHYVAAICKAARWIPD